MALRHMHTILPNDVIETIAVYCLLVYSYTLNPMIANMMIAAKTDVVQLVMATMIASLVMIIMVMVMIS